MERQTQRRAKEQEEFPGVGVQVCVNTLVMDVSNVFVCGRGSEVARGVKSPTRHSKKRQQLLSSSCHFGSHCESRRRAGVSQNA